MSDATVQEEIPLTSPVRTLIDLATCLRPMQLERAVNEADKLDLVKADALREALDDHRGQPGVIRRCTSSSTRLHSGSATPSSSSG